MISESIVYVSHVISADKFLIDDFGCVSHGFQRKKLLGALLAGRAHLLAQCPICQERGNLIRQTVGASGRNQEAGSSVLNRFVYAGGIAANRWNSQQGRFNQYQSESFLGY